MGTVFEVFIFIPSSINNAELREWLQPSRRNKRSASRATPSMDPFPREACQYEFAEQCTLGQIMGLQHWPVFGPKFTARRFGGLTKAAFEAKFKRASDARNDVYHHKSVAQMSNIVAAAEELLDHLHFCPASFA